MMVNAIAMKMIAVKIRVFFIKKSKKLIFLFKNLVIQKFSTTFAELNFTVQRYCFFLI